MMEHLLNYNYNYSNGHLTFSLSKEAPPNCFIWDSGNLSEIKSKEQKFILYIGSIWDSASLVVSHLLGVIALEKPSINFYFKLIDNEMVLDFLLPKSLGYNHLPVIVFVDNQSITIISSGPANQTELEDKISRFA